MAFYWKKIEKNENSALLDHLGVQCKGLAMIKFELSAMKEKNKYDKRTQYVSVWCTFAAPNGLTNLK